MLDREGLLVPRPQTTNVPVTDATFVISIVGDSFSCRVTSKGYTINNRLDCNSNNVAYLINCKVCGLQDVGSTSTKFRLRFKNYNSRLRAH